MTLVLVGIGLLRVNTLVGFAGGFVTGIALVLTLAGVVVVAHHARAGDDQEQGGWWLPSRPEWWLPSEEATADDEVAGAPGTADDGDDR